MHVAVIMYLSWWILPTLIAYPYMGEVPSENNDLSLSCFVDILTNGNIFDYRRRFIWMTCLVVIGLCIASYKVYRLQKHSVIKTQEQIFFLWLIFVTVISCVIILRCFIADVFIGVAPFYVDQRLLFTGIHFCGLLLASAAVVFIINLPQFIFSTGFVQKCLKSGLVLIFIVIMMMCTARRVSNRATLVEVSDQFKTALDNMKNDFKDGRILMHEKLGRLLSLMHFFSDFILIHRMVLNLYLKLILRNTAFVFFCLKFSSKAIKTHL